METFDHSLSKYFEEKSKVNKKLRDRALAGNRRVKQYLREQNRLLRWEHRGKNVLE